MSVPRNKPLFHAPEGLAVRPPPSEMSDPELLRFGMVLESLCSSKAEIEDALRQVYVWQLQDVRKEWLKRFPSLPLSTTFDEQKPPDKTPLS